jgi:hypothetical protein
MYMKVHINTHKSSIYPHLCTNTYVYISLYPADGEEDGSADQWVVENYDEINADIKQKDLEFSKAGYKTLGVSMKLNDGPFQFIGIVTMRYVFNYLFICACYMWMYIYVYAYLYSMYTYK